MGVNAIGRVTEELFAELARLGQVDMDDPEAVRLEISRSKAIEGLCSQLVKASNTTLEHARLRYEIGPGAAGRLGEGS